MQPAMDATPKSRPIIHNLLFLSLLFSSNLLTYLISTTSYSSRFLHSTITDSAPPTITLPSTVHQEYHQSSSESKSSAEIELLPEFLALTSQQKLPFGFNPNFGADFILPPVGRPCTQFPDELNRYMSYQVNGSCPDDERLAQKLLLKGCEPLPRRRCRPAAPGEYVEPYSVPESYWKIPPDSSVVWTAYSCKNYTCLVNRVRNQKAFDDCKDCFDLQGPEKGRWVGPNTKSNLNFTIDEVLAVKKPGTIRIGLDIGGGVGTFAVRMAERNVTIVTTSINLNGPFNNFIASRGVIPLYMTISQRLPFFDNTLDIIHSMHVLSNWIPTTLLNFLLFDIYRVLRPGGIFWLDHFFCVGDQMEQVYIPLIETIGFTKVKWAVGRKLDRGPELREMYLSAVLEKPLKNSW
ncbi:OLC1v1010392C1 [Oldenlandia corymbosa var. corymbosa]|uniref:OLC1v1010392C1 n=1 Tax=Oldenlandia corymbosa var. corymbosa TaxID=529605 RepID=A0AAV1DUL6_OLDCO|nr:OLC1v1010392C1 [Oldenlandia corymbosa var. corymbosa]